LEYIYLATFFINIRKKKTHTIKYTTPIIPGQGPAGGTGRNFTCVIVLVGNDQWIYTKR